MIALRTDPHCGANIAGLGLRMLERHHLQEVSYSAFHCHQFISRIDKSAVVFRMLPCSYKPKPARSASAVAAAAAPGGNASSFSGCGELQRHRDTGAVRSIPRFQLAQASGCTEVLPSEPSALFLFFHTGGSYEGSF